MIAGRITNATRDLGKSQGYIGLPVRDVLVNCTVNGIIPAMETAWHPTPAEIARIVAGRPSCCACSGASIRRCRSTLARCLVTDCAHPAAHLGRVAQRAFDRIACGEKMATTIALQALFEDGLLARKRTGGRATYKVTAMAMQRWQAWCDGR